MVLNVQGYPKECTHTHTPIYQLYLMRLTKKFHFTGCTHFALLTCFPIAYDKTIPNQINDRWDGFILSIIYYFPDFIMSLWKATASLYSADISGVLERRYSLDWRWKTTLGNILSIDVYTRNYRKDVYSALGDFPPPSTFDNLLFT